MVRNRKEKKQKTKEPVRKAKYGTFRCVRWLLSRMWEWDKSLFWSSLLLLPVTVILYALGLYTPSAILERLQTKDQFQNLVLVITALVCAGFVFHFLQDLLGRLRWNAEHRNAMRFYWELLKADAKKDYCLSFEEEYQKSYERVWQILGGNAESSPGRYLIRFFDMLANTVCFLLFGSLVSVINPVILVFLTAGSLLTLLPRRIQQDKDFEERDERNANTRKMNYLAWRLPMILRAGKEIRIYHFVPFLEEKIRAVMGEHIRLVRRQQKHRDLAAYVNFAVGFVRDGLAYLFLIKETAAGHLSPAEFVLYFNAISQLSGFIDNMLQYFGTAHEVMLGISDCIEFFEKPRNRMNHGKGIPLPKGRPLSVEFRDVTYQYPKGERKILEKVSFRIEAGEKISLVGLNGAGKTTLTLLLCGLLLPNEGEILIDGHHLMEYNRDELYTLFSLVPQEYSILPTTVAENIAFCKRDKIDEQKLWNCLEEAELAEKIKSLPKGIDTGMDRQYEEDAVEFSGGETQKLLLARALYHSSSIMILDEPTAALDPIAEDHMYQQYQKFGRNVTSVFISHRLASTRFCDRIYLLEGAHLTEEGTHEELMEKGGRYRELYEIQSKYYKEGGNFDACAES